MFLDHTQRRSTVGRTPLDEWSARRRDLCLTTHDTHNRQTSMPPVGFEPKISAGERPQTYVLDHAATGAGVPNVVLIQLSSWGWAHSCSKHVEDSYKHIIEEIVSSWLPTRIIRRCTARKIYIKNVPLCWLENKLHYQHSLTVQWYQERNNNNFAIYKTQHAVLQFNTLRTFRVI